jgi:hypothetical protein
MFKRLLRWARSTTQASPRETRVPLDPQGEYALIDMRAVHATIQTLKAGTAATEAMIESIISSPDKHPPAVFYLLSHALFQRDRKDEAAFWFYAGQLRARFDACRCTDETASQAVDSLNELFGPQINEQCFKDIPKLEQLIPQVVEWDRRVAHNYDHRWINLHGMVAVNAGLGTARNSPLSVPQEEWPVLAETNRSAYLSGFQEVLKELPR